MKALFCHDCRFLEQDNRIYTEGGFTKKHFERYLSHFKQLTVLARLDDINNGNVSNICLENLVDNVNFIFADINYKNAIKVTKKAIRDADLAIIRLPSIIGTLSVHYCNKFDKPYYVELVGCPWDALWNHSRNGKLIAPLIWRATKRAVKNAPYVSYVTNEFLQRRYPCRGKHISCSDVSLPAVEDGVLEKRLSRVNDMNGTEPVVLGTTAAVDVRYKGQEYVIQAIAELNRNGYNFEYHLVGSGDSTYLKSIAEKCGVTDKVKLLGSLPHEMVFEYLDNIDIYIQPSKTEGLPRALIEAMSRGCPCVGSDAGGIPELTDKDYMFRKGNVKDLVRILGSYNKNDLQQQAVRNFEFSKAYAKDILDFRRSEFLKLFAESVATNG